MPFWWELYFLLFFVTIISKWISQEIFQEKCFFIVSESLDEHENKRQAYVWFSLKTRFFTSDDLFSLWLFSYSRYKLEMARMPFLKILLFSFCFHCIWWKTSRRSTVILSIELDVWWQYLALNQPFHWNNENHNIFFCSFFLHFFYLPLQEKGFMRICKLLLLCLFYFDDDTIPSFGVFFFD